MLNGTARFLLASTSLAPMAGAVAISEYAGGADWKIWALWLAVVFFMVMMCWILLKYASKNPQSQLFHVKEFERNDQEVLAFLLAYLLPFVSGESLAFTDNWLVSAYIWVVILVVIANSGALHFNPVMGFLGYHFYAVRNGDGVSHLLISKQELTRPLRDIDVVRLGHSIYLHKET